MKIAIRSLVLASSLLLTPLAARAQDVPPPAPPAPPLGGAPPPAPPPPTVSPLPEPPVTSHEDSSAPPEPEPNPKVVTIAYKPGKGLEIGYGKTRLRAFFALESVFQYGHCAGDNCNPTDATTWHVRRARAAFDVKLPHHWGITFALQIKNEILVVKAAYLSWEPKKTLQIISGFLKPPGGIERDASTWIKPFPERSVVANFKKDRIIGVRVYDWASQRHVRLGFAAGKSPAGNFDAFEPEDVVAPPAGIEPEDLSTDPGNWELFATFAWVPSDSLEVGLNTAAHIAPDAGQGPNFAEPYESKIVSARFYHGVYLDAGADMVMHTVHSRLSAEVVGFRSGETIPHTDPVTGMPLEPTDPETGVAGYVVAGWGPHAEYGQAIENDPLLESWQLLLRGEFLYVTPGETSTDAALFVSGTGGLEWQATKQVRLQTDLAVQKYNDQVFPVNVDAWRTYFELWAQVKM